MLAWIAPGPLALAETPAPTEQPHDATRDTQPAPPPRRPEAGGGEKRVLPLDQVRKNVLDGLNAGSPAWWESAHDFLARAAKDDIDKLAAEIPVGNRQDLFRELIKARGTEDTAKLREAAQAATGSAARDASRQEMLRRISDPNAKFLAKWFSRRPELAATDAQKLLKGDDAAAAETVAKLMGGLNRVQREALKKKLEALAVEGAEANGLDPKLVQRLLEAAKISTGGTADSAFAKAFDTDYKGVLEKNKRFYEQVARAAGGDTAAKAQLLKDYDPEEVMDFIGAQLNSRNDGVAVDVARAFARTDATGNAFLDLAASNSAFGDSNRNQVLLLGKEREEMRAALQAFHLGGAEDHSEASAFEPGTTSRFQRFKLSPDAANQNPVRVFAGSDGGNPKLKRTTEPGRPAEALAKEKVRVPNVLPVVTPPPTAAQVTGGGPFDAKKLAEFIQTNCTKCHAMITSGDNARNFKISNGKPPLSLADTMEAIDKERGGMKVKPEIKEAFRKFVQQAI